MFSSPPKIAIIGILTLCVSIFNPIVYATTLSDIKSRSDILLEIHYSHSIAPIWLDKYFQIDSIPAALFTTYLQKLVSFNQNTTRSLENEHTSYNTLINVLESFEKPAEERTALEKQFIADNQYAVKTLFEHYLSKEERSIYQQTPEKFTTNFARAILVKTILSDN